jgi:Transglutaminase-like superfamily
MRAWHERAEMLQGLRRFLALPAPERRLLLLLMVLQPAISLALRFRGYRRTHHWLLRRSGHPTPHVASSIELAAAERVASLAGIAGRRGPVATTCLRQSLAVFWLLRRRGLQPELGVDCVGPTADMHAWVELEGVPLAQPRMRHAAFQPATSASTVSTTSSRTS